MTEEQANYWFPTEKGEQNEILQKLQKNIIHPTSLTLFLERLPKILFFTFVSIYVSYVASLFQHAPLFDERNIFAFFVAGISCVAGAALATYYFVNDKHVYLLDFAVAELGKEYETKVEDCLGPLVDVIGKDSADFVLRVAKKTGLGQQTYLPKMFHSKTYQPKSMALCREELDAVVSASCDKLFAQTGLDPKTDIDCLISNCSIFSPTPSIATTIMNKYKMKQTCMNWHLGGMGCAASINSVDLAKYFLHTHPNSTVLLFSTEIVTDSVYTGTEKSHLMFFTLFRSGGAAILLTNKKSLIKNCKYELEETVRVHNAIDDGAHKVIYHCEDSDGNVGLSIGKTLVDYVAAAIKENFKILLPRYLPLFDKIKYQVRNFFAKEGETIDFNLNLRETFQGYCIHSGGRGIIDAVQKTFNLTDEDCMPSRAGLCRFGNTSSASIWYEFMFIERCELIKKNERVLQLAFGSGVKANSCVWRKIY